MQYPAMMVPQMVRALLDGICAVEQNVARIADPFVGSGTVLTETMLRGLSFAGRDINPLAILLCRVKVGPLFPEALRERTEEAIVRARADSSNANAVSFDGLQKWFRRDVQIGLSRLRRAILAENAPWGRRFLWVALAETVRLTCNSRTSTFKLHIREEEDIAERRACPIDTFAKLVKRNLERIDSLSGALRYKRLLNRGHYSESATICLGDSRKEAVAANEEADVVITSPPYGDNATTVPYGQYSYLPLQWLELSDIDARATAEYLRTTHEIDRRSLGGSRRVDLAIVGELKQRSATFGETIRSLRYEKVDRARRVTAFVRDLEQCLPHVENTLRPGGVMVWVLGNRRVGGRFVPLDEILAELLQSRGATNIMTIRRRIPTKRMAIRNSVADTMANETILIMRKGGGNANDG